MERDEQVKRELSRVVYWLDHHADERGQTWEQIAVFAGISRSSLYQIKRGSAPTLRTLGYVANYLGVDVRDLLAPTPEEKTPGLPATAD